MNKPKENKWYWVREDNDEWFPAMHRTLAVGGWDNLDTWEDWGGDIVEWVEIVPPGRPAAKCFCKDCVWYESKKWYICPVVDRTVSEDDFCCWGDPK